MYDFDFPVEVIRTNRKKTVSIHIHGEKVKVRAPKFTSDEFIEKFVTARTNWIIKKLSDNTLLTVRAAENVVRLLPPLNVTKREINLGLKIIEKVCKNYK